MQYSSSIYDSHTPQTSQLDASQVLNNAGGYVYAIDQWKRLERFLILGSENGTYYCSEKTLTLENANNLKQCLRDDGVRTVKEIVSVSQQGRAPKNDEAIFALALACSIGDANTKAAARSVINKVCRTGTHLFQFCQSIQDMGTWGRGLRSAVASWYTDKSLDSLAYQLVKYRQRNGWTHRDVLRLAHPKASYAQSPYFSWAVGKGSAPVGSAIASFEYLKTLTHNPKLAAEFIAKTKLPREAVPTDLLNSPEVWEALLEHMPFIATLRNLGKMSSIGLAVPMSDATKKIVSILSDRHAMKASKVHPASILLALKTYEKGCGHKGRLTWDVVSNIVDATNDAFYAAFDTIVPSERPIMLALDVSGSMSASTISGTGCTPREASAAMAMATLRVEPYYGILGFSGGMVPLKLSKGMKLSEVCRVTESLPFESTDCSQPILYAIKHRLAVETFVVYTDNETYAGRIHPSQALDQYRQMYGRPSKLIVVGMTSGGFSIAKPNDPGMLDVVGFDSSAPSIISEFSKE